MINKTIAIANDHAGYEMKMKLVEFLRNLGFETEDMGTYSTESCDYSDFGHKLGKSINDGRYKTGIAICGSGNGINITVNKYPKVRAALCWNNEISSLARKHNDANICTLPGRFVDFSQACEIIQTFLSTDFEGGRHQKRIDKIPI